MGFSAIESINSCIKELKLYRPGKAIDALQKQLGIKKIIKLASNENPLGMSPKVTKAITNSLSRMHRYPDANATELKQQLATKLNVTPEQLTLGNGSENVLAVIMQTFIKSTDEILLTEFCFEAYPLLATKHQARLKIIPAKNWGIDLTATIAAISTATKMILFANPNNPTNFWITESELIDFLQAVPGHVIVIVDEAYFEYCSAADYPNSIKLQQRFPNLITTRTFSKIYGLAGLRLGYAISSPDIANYLNRVRSPFNTNAMVQIAGLAALDDTDFIDKSLALNVQSREHLLAGLQQLNCELLTATTNFVTIKLQHNAQDIFNALLQHGIIIRPLDAYNLPQHIRVTFGLEEENHAFLQAFATVLKL